MTKNQFAVIGLSPYTLFVYGMDGTCRGKRIQESVDKPGSVANNHLSGMFVAKHLKQPTRTQRGSRFELCSSVSSYLALLQAGFALP